MLHFLLFRTTEGKKLLNNSAVQLAGNVVQLRVSFDNAVRFPIQAINFTFSHFQKYIPTFSTLSQCLLCCKVLSNSVHSCAINTKVFYYFIFLSAFSGNVFQHPGLTVLKFSFQLFNNGCQLFLPLQCSSTYNSYMMLLAIHLTFLDFQQCFEFEFSAVSIQFYQF